MHQDNNNVLVQLDVLSTLAGHEKGKIIIDDDPAKRKFLAEKVTSLIRDGFSVLLNSGERVRGYDADTNDWLVASTDHLKAKKGFFERISALGRPANAIAPITGG